MDIREALPPAPPSAYWAAGNSPACWRLPPATWVSAATSLRPRSTVRLSPSPPPARWRATPISSPSRRSPTRLTSSPTSSRTCPPKPPPSSQAVFPWRPASQHSQTAQDRVAEKTFISGLGIPVAPFADVADVESLEAALSLIGRPAILKTRRFGYDGKGQTRIDDAKSAATAFAEIGQLPAILEGFVRFDKEISVIAARNWSGEVAVYDVPENHHENHILKTSTVPADISPAVAEIGPRLRQPDHRCARLCGRDRRRDVRVG